jgi:hypothetical protein
MLRISAGYKYFVQKRYDYESGNKNLRNIYRNFGPVLKLIIYLSKQSYVNFIGGIEYLNYSGENSYTSQKNMQINIMWNL